MLNHDNWQSSERTSELHLASFILQRHTDRQVRCNVGNQVLQRLGFLHSFYMMHLIFLLLHIHIFAVLFASLLGGVALNIQTRVTSCVKGASCLLQSRGR